MLNAVFTCLISCSLKFCRLKGFPFWPGKLMRVNSENNTDIRSLIPVYMSYILIFIYLFTCLLTFISFQCSHVFTCLTYVLTISSYQCSLPFDYHQVLPVYMSCMYSYRVFFHWYPPKKFKYGKPRLGESTLT